MGVFRSCRLGAVLVVAMAAGLPHRAAAQATGQTMLLAERGPRFLLASVRGGAPVEINAASSAVLGRVVSLNLEHPTVGRLLDAIERQTHLRFYYGPDVLSPDRPVSLRADSITVAAALVGILADAGVDVLLSRTGPQVALVRRAPAVPVQGGRIAGQVTAKLGGPLAGAVVVVDGTARSATTGEDGRYRIADVAPGTYTVRARYIGYAPGSASVRVSADQEATADFALEKSAQPLEEIVTTGTVVPTEVKALPTPVSIIGGDEIAAQRPHTVQEVFRQAVPTAVSADVAAFPWNTGFSVRGASSLAAGSGQMKVFVDGIEVANQTIASIDPTSIDRVEVVRGPQAAAIYGSDAVGGVIQVFTKRGDSSLTRPQVQGEAAAGLIQTPYSGYGSVGRQSYRGSVSGGGSGMSYNFGAGYTHTPDWAGPASAQSSGSVYGGVRITRGILSADVSGRSYVQNTPQVDDPNLAATGFSFWSKPFYQPVQMRAQSVGARLTIVPASWWHHTITLGVDRLNEDQSQTQARLTSPADTFLSYFNMDQTKTSIGYNTSFTGALTRSGTASVTLGFDHYSLPVTQWFTGTALSTSQATGTLGPTSFTTRTVTNNTGYFAQGQLSFRDALFITGGIRAEQNTNFGDSLGTPVSPRAGLAYVHALAGVTVKLRGSWGRAIRPPGPGVKLGSVSQSGVFLPNPHLAPERQQGWDTGIDLIIGNRGSVSITYFDQAAENLIAPAILAATPQLTIQNQNVGRVENRGVEVEGSYALGMLQFRGQYGYVHSRIRELGPTYTGDLAVGDQPLSTPTHTAGGAFTLTPRGGTQFSIGATYVGASYGYDYFAFYSCLGGTGPCATGPGVFRPYLTRFPSIFKVNATLSQQFTQLVSAFASVDNLNNDTDHEYSSVNAVMGRITTVGLSFHY